MVVVEWRGGMAFDAEAASGARFALDAHPDHGGRGLGPTPVEALLSAIAACSAMDVLSILQKKRQAVTAYRVVVEGDRTPEGVYPRPFTAIRIRHLVSGDGLDPAAVQRAVELSDGKYCSVIATLRAAPDVSSVWEIV